VSAYLYAPHSALARELAAELGIAVTSRGPVSIAVCDEVAELQ
jgi:hypothetical protein